MGWCHGATAWPARRSTPQSRTAEPKRTSPPSLPVSSPRSSVSVRFKNKAPMSSVSFSVARVSQVLCSDAEGQGCGAGQLPASRGACSPFRRWSPAYHMQLQPWGAGCQAHCPFGACEQGPGKPRHAVTELRLSRTQHLLLNCGRASRLPQGESRRRWCAVPTQVTNPACPLFLREPGSWGQCWCRQPLMSESSAVCLWLEGVVSG